MTNPIKSINIPEHANKICAKCIIYDPRSLSVKPNLYSSPQPGSLPLLAQWLYYQILKDVFFFKNCHSASTNFDLSADV